jgi:uncharacterized DUF497 family protein
MKIEFDSDKNERNIKIRCISFELAEEFDWDTAIYYKDDRKKYPESRIIALGFLNERLHVMCFTPIVGGVRVISFRKANKREVSYYEKETPNQ